MYITLHIEDDGMVVRLCVLVRCVALHGAKSFCVIMNEEQLTQTHDKKGYMYVQRSNWFHYYLVQILLSLAYNSK